MCVEEKTIMRVNVVNKIIEVCTKCHKTQRRGNNSAWGVWDWKWFKLSLLLWGWWAMGYERDIPGRGNILGKCTGIWKSQSYKEHGIFHRILVC